MSEPLDVIKAGVEDARKAMKAAERMILRYRRALEFYGDPRNYVRRDHYSTPSQDFPAWSEPSEVMNDGGDKARQALGQPEPEDPHAHS